VPELRAVAIGLADRQPVERQRHVAGQHVQQVVSKDFQMFGEARRRQPFSGALEGAHLARLVGDHRRQESVAIAEPLVEAFLGAVGGARQPGRRQRLVATLHQKPQGFGENGALARREFGVGGFGLHD
jgi:hypothetical protein